MVDAGPEEAVAGGCGGGGDVGVNGAVGATVSKHPNMKRT